MNQKCDEGKKRKSRENIYHKSLYAFCLSDPAVLTLVPSPNRSWGRFYPRMSVELWNRLKILLKEEEKEEKCKFDQN